MIKVLGGLLTLFLFGSCVIGIVISANFNRKEDKEDSNTPTIAADQNGPASSRSSGKASKVTAAKESQPRMPEDSVSFGFSPISEVQVSSDDQFTISLISGHLYLISSEMADAFDQTSFRSTWKPLQKTKKEFKAVVEDELDFVQSQIVEGIPEKVKKLFEIANSIIREDLRDFSIRQPRVELVAKIWSECLNKVKTARDETRKSFPHSKLVEWTKERVRKRATIPSSVKFGWFVEAVPGVKNRSARVEGTFKASNAFNLTTKYEFTAKWSLNENDLWQMDALYFDGNLVYADPDVVKGLAQSITKGKAAGKLWGGHREKLKASSSAVQNSSNGFKTWVESKRSFTSDKGTKLDARFVESKMKSGLRMAILEKSDGTNLSVDIQRLSAKDREFIASQVRSTSELAAWKKNSRLFTSLQGAEIQATVKSFRGNANGGVVYLELLDSSIIKVEVRMLVDEDQDYVKKVVDSRR